MGDTERTPSDTSGIDPADIQQSSPAEAEAEVSDPDGNEDTDSTEGGLLNVAPIAATGIVGGGAGVGQV